ncbi:hypothetical protein [Kiloniella sp.]|uniref:hypothetical protein n=1 Tax=Kiloniella sp. TaxID=1938587 RepID=UPI003B0278CD
MTDKLHTPIRRIINGIVAFWLVAIIIGMVIANDTAVESAYKHVNEHSKNLHSFSDVSENSYFKAIHILLPVNPANISLWGDKSDKDGYVLSFSTVLFIILSTVVVLKSSKKILYQVPIIFLVCGIVFLFGDVNSAVPLILSNCIFYGFAIYCIYIGIVKSRLNIKLFGIVFWLWPNVYQVMFLDGLYI